MDTISNYQLSQYKGILDETNGEFQKSERLKAEIENAENSIVALKLCASDFRHKIGHVNVKVFSSIFEIINLYNTELNTSHKEETFDENKNYFLVEVFVAKTLLKKLVTLDWKLQISVRTDLYCFSKTVDLREKNSILEIFPVDKSIIECTIESRLFQYSEDNWNALDLNPVSVDISYYYEAYKEKSNTLEDKLLNVTKLYNEGATLQCVTAPTNLQFEMKCSLDQNNFVSTFVKNSFHRLNFESLSDFINDSKRAVDIQFSVNNSKVILLFHKDTKVMKLKCRSDLLLAFKKYFLQFSKCGVDLDGKIKQVVKKKGGLEYLDLNEMRELHHQLRKLWV